jgi:hypothetical protein
MKWITAAVQGGEPEAISVDRLEEIEPGAGIAQQGVQIAMRGRRKVSGSDLNDLNTKAGSRLEGGRERKVHEPIGEQSDLHVISSRKVATS